MSPRPARRPRKPIGGKLASADRKMQLITIGLRLAVEYGYERVTRDMIAARAGCSGGLISLYWTAPDLQWEIMTEAVRTGCLSVLAQGLASRHPVALEAPIELREAAAMSIIT